jgi:hypothetical protein
MFLTKNLLPKKAYMSKQRFSLKALVNKNV